MYKPNFHKYQAGDGVSPSSSGGGWGNWGQDNGGQWGGSDNWSEPSWAGYTTGSNDNSGSSGGNWGQFDGGGQSPGYTTGGWMDKSSPQFDPGPAPEGNDNPWYQTAWENLKKFGQQYGQKIMTAAGGVYGGPLGAVAGGGLGGMLFGTPDQSPARRAGNGIFGGVRDAAAGAAQGVFGIPASVTSGVINRAAQAPGTANPTMNPGDGVNSDPYQGGLGNVFRSAMNYYGTRGAMSDLDNQRSSLTSLYDQNGAYSQNLRNQLAARGSAAGTRGQTSSAEVALQAELAKMAAQAAPQIGAIDSNRQSVRNNRNAQMYNILSDIFAR